MKDYNYSENNHCNCGQLITNKAKKCLKCRNLQHSKRMSGKNNPFFGKKRTKHSKKMKQLYSVPENCPNFKHGKASKNRKCIECNQLITAGSKLGRCKSCSRKGKLHYLFGKHLSEKTKQLMSENHANVSASNNPAWQGGLNKRGYYLFTLELKESIRNRDNHECQLCYVKEKNYYRKLDIHHIDYDKQNCKEENLITLCSKCNIHVNNNRDYWYAYFKYIMESIYEFRTA